MKLKEVISRQDVQHFLNVVELIYKDDSTYVRPLDQVVEEVFDPSENKFFKHGRACRFVLYDDSNMVIGRIAAFVNDKKGGKEDVPVGGVGYFECIDDEAAAFTLFDEACVWLKKQGMKGMEGPINFGENDRFWGLLVEGFTHPGFGMQYNPPYYKKLFEAYGFKPHYDQITNHLDLTRPFPERFWKIARWVVDKPDYTFKHFKWSNADQFLDDFVTIYNDAWQYHENFTPINKEALRVNMTKSRAFMEERLIWYAYHNNQPVACIVMYPDVNELIKGFKGKLSQVNKLRFAWRRWRKKYTRTRVVVMGVRPKYQRSGLESGLFWQLRDVMGQFGHIREMELSWVGDFNPKMRALHESLGATFGKKHITYRMGFGMDLEQAKTIPVDTKYTALK
jgi:hypothetical protein